MQPEDMTKALGSPNAFVASIIWGAAGSGFFIYGWKQKSTVPLWGGIALTAGSYFFADSALIMSLFSIAVIAGIYFLRGRF
jgi:hypothetical protein